jgi:hypothetical protein
MAFPLKTNKLLWQKNQLSLEQKNSQSTGQGWSAVVFVAAGGGGICATLMFAAFVSGSWLPKE